VIREPADSRTDEIFIRSVEGFHARLAIYGVAPR
jgi:hypothetical protein